MQIDIHTITGSTNSDSSTLTVECVMEKLTLSINPASAATGGSL